MWEGEEEEEEVGIGSLGFDSEPETPVSGFDSNSAPGFLEPLWTQTMGGRRLCVGVGNSGRWWYLKFHFYFYSCLTVR